MPPDANGTSGPEERLARLERLRAEVTSALAHRDLARDADGATDGHHHPAEAATDATSASGSCATSCAGRSARPA